MDPKQGLLHGLSAVLTAHAKTQPGDNRVQQDRRHRAELAALTLSDIGTCGPAAIAAPSWFEDAVRAWIEAGAHPERVTPLDVIAAQVRAVVPEGYKTGDCAIHADGGTRYPRDFGNDPAWRNRAEHGVSIGIHVVHFDPPVLRGDLVDAVEAMGYRFNDSPR